MRPCSGSSFSSQRVTLGRSTPRWGSGVARIASSGTTVCAPPPRLARCCAHAPAGGDRKAFVHQGRALQAVPLTLMPRRCQGDRPQSAVPRRRGPARTFFVPRFFQNPPRDDALALRCDFTSISCQGDSHPRAVEHVRHQMKVGGPSLGLPWSWTLRRGGLDPPVGHFFGTTVSVAPLDGMIPVPESDVWKRYVSVGLLLPGSTACPIRVSGLPFH